MKKFMVVIFASDEDGEETFAKFFDTYGDASNARMDAECGMGWYAEIYVRQETECGREYVFLEA